MINVKMQPTEVQKLSPKISVIGVGGAGGNAVNNMISSNLDGCEFLVCNTDAQALENSLCQDKLQLGADVTGGLGAGSKPEIGRQAAEESLEEVLEHLEGANMAFVTAGMGGGTGTGAAPIIAKACRERGILTVGVVTKPFHFEGSHRMKMAEKGIEEMQGYVDTLIVIPNQNLFRIANEKTTFADAFGMADDVLKTGVRGVIDLMVRPGLVNLDFADIRTAMLEMGKAMMGTGEACGEKRAIEAAEAAINNPLLDDVSMKGANGVIINVTGGYDMTLFEADEACNRIRDEVDPDANIIFGATFDESMEGTMRVSIVATGIEKEAMQKYYNGGGTGRAEVASKAGLERATPNVSDEPTGKEEIAEAPQKQASMGHSSPPMSHSSPTPPASAYTAGADSIRGITAPPTSQDPESDLFEQNRSGAEAEQGKNADAEDVSPSMRGTRYKDSFIPPQAVMPEKTQAAETGSSLPLGLSAVGSSSMSAPPSSAPSSSSLELKPPKAPEARDRAPSLFERITGSVQQTLSGVVREENRTAAAPRPAPMTGTSGGAVTQGSLNIDAPAAQPSGKSEDELDIPAFLRRQAN